MLQTPRSLLAIAIVDYSFKTASSRVYLPELKPSGDNTSSTSAALAPAELDYNLSLQEHDNDLLSSRTPTTVYLASPRNYQPG